jgi:hypothetical protein
LVQAGSASDGLSQFLLVLQAVFVWVLVAIGMYAVVKTHARAAFIFALISLLNGLFGLFQLIFAAVTASSCPDVNKDNLYYFVCTGDTAPYYVFIVLFVLFSFGSSAIAWMLYRLEKEALSDEADRERASVRKRKDNFYPT